MKARIVEKQTNPVRFERLAVFALIAVAAGCGRAPNRILQRSQQPGAPPPAKIIEATSVTPDPCRLVLVPLGGDAPLDQKILRAQERIRTASDPLVSIEQLGWLFVSKARASFDPGYYKLAEQCALCMESKKQGAQEALLLRGHVLHNLHRFKEAEPLARQLTTARGLPADFGLLADVLMEQGKLDEAMSACQKMLDLRPDLHSYARGAHLRWLKGNLAGAESLMSLAASAASPLDSESAAWVNTRLAGYQFESGAIAEAEQTCAAALDYQRDYPPALLLRGRLLMAQDRYADAAEQLRRAARLNPLPEYQWALAEALCASGRAEDAAQVETQLRQKGASSDPRTFSLFLANRGESVETAVRLATDELNCRQDIFTRDALAWALTAAGRVPEAQKEDALALAEGTQDGRLFFHAAIIAHKAGRPEEARQFAERAEHLKRQLLPSERQQLKSTFPLTETVAVRSGN